MRTKATVSNEKHSGEKRALTRVGLTALMFMVLVATTSPVWSSDGQIEINQAAVIAGAITPGDSGAYPATLSLPGSYILTGNLTLPHADASGIEITADNVTLDLNGFSIIGGTECTNGDCVPLGTGNGIYSANNNITIRNGQVRGAGNYGIFLEVDTHSSVVEGVEVVSNGRHGIVGALYGTIRNCVAYNNGQTGVLAGLRSSILNSKASNNGLDGFTMGSATISGGGIVQGNSSFGNGRYGYQIGSGASVVGNSASDNASYGLRLGSLAGYGNNVLNRNNSQGTQKLGGRSMGNNVCQGIANDDC